MTNPICLNNECHNWVSQINLKFTYGITIDLWDYFPLLKQGRCYRDTLTSFLHIYKLFHKYDERYKHGIFDKDDCLKDVHNDTTDDPQLNIEKLYAKQLCDCINYLVYTTCIYISLQPYNKLCELLIAFENIYLDSVFERTSSNFKTIEKQQTLFDRLLLNDNIKLISAILNRDSNKIYQYLYVDNIDPRLYNNELYKLSIKDDIEMNGLIKDLKEKRRRSKHIEESLQSSYEKMFKNNETKLSIVDIISLSSVLTEKLIVPKIISDDTDIKIRISEMIIDITIKRNWIKR